MRNPLVSICVPAYNHEAYIADCIESVIAQSYRNIELIVVDDGSVDQTWERLNRLRTRCEARFARVVFQTRENRGRAATFQELLSLANGELIGFIASDDRYFPLGIELLVQALCAHPEMGVVVGRNRIMDGAGCVCCWDEKRVCVPEGPLARYRTFDEWLETHTGVRMGGPDFGSYRHLLNANHVPNGSLQRTEVLRRVNAFDVRAPLEDLWMHLQLSKVTKYGYVGKDVFSYRWHGCNSAIDVRKIWRQERTSLLLEIRTAGLRAIGVRMLWVCLCPLWVRSMLKTLKGGW